MSEARYLPEWDYKQRNFKPFRGPPSLDMCGGCKAYYKDLFDKGLTTTPFPPDCQGHVANKMEGLSPESFKDDEEFQDALLSLDPISWAQAEFGWTPRWYQEYIMSCTSKKKILRGGRRSGKSEAMVMEMLYEIGTNKNHTVLLIAPFEALVNRLFAECRKFISISQNLRNSIARSTMGPNLIEFNNGSKILGFSVGPQAAGRGADKIRGQDAHLIVIDEMDTMLDPDIDAIMAILASHPESRIITASTPRGWRKKFYQLVTDKSLGFKETWFISAESPVWTEKTEEFFRRQANSENAFAQEYLADFGEVEEGVFKKQHIERCIEQYTYADCQVSAGNKYILGVDWNKSAGTHMIVLEWDSKKLKLVDKIVVPEAEYMQTSSVQKIIDLDKIWNFKHIFADAGYGHVQLELLKKHGLNNRGTRLDQKVHAIHMNQNIDIMDPTTGMPIKKFAKPFLVMQTVKLMEDGFLVLPKIEDTAVSTDNKNMGLIQQMREYKVESYSIYGQPRYSQGQDHTLTAYMLAAAGFAHEEGELKNVRYSSKVVGVESSPMTAQLELTPTEKERSADLMAGQIMRNSTGTVNTNNRRLATSRDFDQSVRSRGQGFPVKPQSPRSGKYSGPKRGSF